MAADPEAWGVATSYVDASGQRRSVPAATVEAMLDAMCASGRPPAPQEKGPGAGRPEPGASDGRCPAPPAGRHWGVAVQLYATRSESSWGIGDLSDLARLASWAESVGARFVLINPLHAVAPTHPQQPSPYYPASRCFYNPIYLRVEDVAGAEAAPSLPSAAREGRGLNAEPRIDRDRVWRLKSRVLEEAFARAGVQDDDLDAYIEQRGDALVGFATYCALAERHGPVWSDWPAGFRHPRSPEVAAWSATEAAATRIRYHCWLQWQLDRQLRRAASAGAGLVADLAVGVDPGGADAWWWQDTFVTDMRVGAPPDAFNPNGQDWALPPLDPWRLEKDGFAPFIETIRAGFRHAAGMRVDHVMGLFRLFWIPSGAPATEGTYVRYPAERMLDILSAEARRSGAFVVGEDLGTVEPGVRSRLSERGVLSYRLLYFEDAPPESWPEAALGAVTTHDLPTIAGVWSGTDRVCLSDIGFAPDDSEYAVMGQKLAESAGSPPDAPVGEVIAGAYGAVAGSPCALVAATLDDMLGVELRPNVPGTVDESPDWCLALPKPIEQIEADPLVSAVAGVMRRLRPRAHRR